MERPESDPEASKDRADGAVAAGMPPLEPPPPPPPPAAQAAPRPAPSPPSAGWGPWASLALAAGVLVLYALVQVVAVGVVAAVLAVAAGGGAIGQDDLAAQLGAHFGLIFWIGLIIATPVAGAALVLLAAARSPRGLPGAAAWLGLDRPSRRAVLGWLLATLAAAAGYDALTDWLDRPPIPEFMVEAWRTAGFLPALAVAVVVLAPAFEELLFRGFLYAGLARSRLGPLGAIVVAAAGWAAIHRQYDLIDAAAIFVLGLLFGAARWRTGSTTLAFGLHAAVNLTAVVQVGLRLGW